MKLKRNMDVLAAYRALIRTQAPVRLFKEREGPGASVLWCLFVDPRECSLPAVRKDRWSNNPMVNVDHRTDMEVLRVSSLYVPAKLRNMGFATALMNAVLQFQRDRVQLPLYLEAMPYAQMPMTQAQLFEFYGRFGFTRCAGHPYAMHRNV